MDWLQIILGVGGGLVIGGGLAFVIQRGRSEKEQVQLEEELARLTHEAREEASLAMKEELAALTEQVEAEAATVREQQRVRTKKLQEQEDELDGRAEQARRQENHFQGENEILGAERRRLRSESRSFRPYMMSTKPVLNRWQASRRAKPARSYWKRSRRTPRKLRSTAYAPSRRKRRA